MQRIIVFDVNETLLDLHPVRIWFSERFGDEPDASMWFSELLRLSFVWSVLDRYRPFPELAAAALATSAERHGAAIEDGDISHIGGMFTTLPAHPEVTEGLDALLDAGFAISALTNSPHETAVHQLRNAGIADRFDEVLSVEMVRRFKPHASVYNAAARSLGVDTSGLVMVAAHDWDVAGAMSAGCEGVFVSRRGQVFSPSFDPPTFRASDISDAAQQIITHFA